MSYDAQAIAGRSALLDAAFALRSQMDSLVLVGAQAVYLYTGDSDVAVATTTKDCDLAIVPELLSADPTIEAAMTSAGFKPDERGHQGKWLNRTGTPVDLLVAEGAQDFGGGRIPRGARIPPHSDTAARTVKGIEGAGVDNQPMRVSALAPDDERSIEIKVAGPAALLVAKTWKICERIDAAEKGGRDRTTDKDAHDLYRLLRRVGPGEVAAGLALLRGNEVSRETTIWALEALSRHGTGPDSPICVQAGRAEQLVGDPELVAESMATLTREVLDATGD